MGTYTHSHLMEGDLVGTRDIGMTAWIIRWNTAGWGQRDDMNVWVHTGVLTDYNGDGHYHIADMYAGRSNHDFAINNIDTYMNGPSGNPSINDVRRSKSISGSLAVRLWSRTLITYMATLPSKYDMGALFGQLFGGAWNSSSAYLCTEMSFHIICTLERAAGYRKQNGVLPFWPTLGIFNVAAHQYNYREHDWGVIWNVPQIGDMTSPWFMKRGCSQGCGWYARSWFYV